ncbi:hypothetical protein DENSPDRAFT_934771 [Dentipellis sp. KUC8613]|nr:hypothetical protein DENSPDRAFT_934771 [Dentipellis sp. KUC8613]
MPSFCMPSPPPRAFVQLSHPFASPSRRFASPSHLPVAPLAPSCAVLVPGRAVLAPSRVAVTQLSSYMPLRAVSCRPSRRVLPPFAPVCAGAAPLCAISRRFAHLSHPVVSSRAPSRHHRTAVVPVHALSPSAPSSRPCAPLVPSLPPSCRLTASRNPSHPSTPPLRLLTPRTRAPSRAPSCCPRAPSHAVVAPPVAPSSRPVVAPPRTPPLCPSAPFRALHTAVAPSSSCPSHVLLVPVSCPRCVPSRRSPRHRRHSPYALSHQHGGFVPSCRHFTHSSPCWPLARPHALTRPAAPFPSPIGRLSSHPIVCTPLTAVFALRRAVMGSPRAPSLLRVPRSALFAPHGAAPHPVCRLAPCPAVCTPRPAVSLPTAPSLAPRPLFARPSLPSSRSVTRSQFRPAIFARHCALSVPVPPFPWPVGCVVPHPAVVAWCHAPSRGVTRSQHLAPPSHTFALPLRAPTAPFRPMAPPLAPHTFVRHPTPPSCTPSARLPSRRTPTPVCPAVTHPNGAVMPQRHLRTPSHAIALPPGGLARRRLLRRLAALAHAHAHTRWNQMDGRGGVAGKR